MVGNGHSAVPKIMTVNGTNSSFPIGPRMGWVDGWWQSPIPRRTIIGKSWHRDCERLRGAGGAGGAGEGKEIKHSHKSSKLTLFELCMATKPTKISPFTI